MKLQIALVFFFKITFFTLYTKEDVNKLTKQ